VTSPSLNYAVSTGEDGVVKVWDFVRKNVVTLIILFWKRYLLRTFAIFRCK